MARVASFVSLFPEQALRQCAYILAFYAANGAGTGFSLAGKNSTLRKIRVAESERTPNNMLNPHAPCIQATNGSVDAITENDTTDRSA